jgi:COP9 signalosome complex subunit 5
MESQRPLRRLEAAMAHQAKAALQTFSLTNDITNVSPQDEIYKYDAEENRKILRAEPWKSE